MSNRISISGGKQIAARLSRISQAVPTKVELALRKGALMIERDAKLECPVDTGRLRNDISHKIIDSGTNDPKAEIGNSLRYAPFVEQGTSKQAAQPFLRPAFEKNIEKIKDLIKEAVRKSMKK